ncbi:nucleotidyltransferase domain-containing protein [Risungbinella massiliensis]|uniref:nucleotidyltransferase domain-containing protein n=1 Tax=Risungbinella massiliensis TaxID=1329796 RepID=UPI00069A8DBE|nr:nucleotidyltransferase domain-containing protein [Risungbinella massiliensis]
MSQLILDYLDHWKEKEGIQIFYAVESGSRVWGFATEDSDYDVRFLFHRELKDYVGIGEFPATITGNHDGRLDGHGWDIRKMAGLLSKSNPSIMEWLFSPIVYIEKGVIIQELRRLAREHFSARRLAYHHFSMVRSHFKSHIQQQTKMNPKAYLHTLRSLFTVLYLEERPLLLPPYSIEKLAREVKMSDHWYEVINHLIEAKQNIELKWIKPLSDLDQFISDFLEKSKQRVQHIPDRAFPSDQLNELVYQQLLTTITKPPSY